MLDKVRCVAIGAIVSIPFLVYYVWYSFIERLQDTEVLWLVVAIISVNILGIIFGIIINPRLAYKRNDEICVSGLPFPIFYGMPVEDGCIAGHYVFRNLILDIIYSCLFSSANVLFLLSIGSKTGGFYVLFLMIFAIPAAILYFLDIILKFYPIQND